MGGGSSKSKSRSPEQKPQPQPRFALEYAVGSSAWDDVVTLSSRDGHHAAKFVAIHADLGMARLTAGNGGFTIDDTAYGDAVYSMPAFGMPFGGTLDMEAQCWVHISRKDADRNLCAFVYEVSSPVSNLNSRAFANHARHSSA